MKRIVSVFIIVFCCVFSANASKSNHINIEGSFFYQQVKSDRRFMELISGDLKLSNFHLKVQLPFSLYISSDPIIFCLDNSTVLAGYDFAKNAGREYIPYFYCSLPTHYDFIEECLDEKKYYLCGIGFKNGFIIDPFVVKTGIAFQLYSKMFEEGELCSDYWAVPLSFETIFVCNDTLAISLFVEFLLKKASFEYEFCLKNNFKVSNFYISPYMLFVGRDSVFSFFGTGVSFSYDFKL